MVIIPKLTFFWIYLTNILVVSQSCDVVQVRDSSIQPCKFPFTFKGKQYNTCTEMVIGKSWCPTKLTSDGTRVQGQGYWGYCNEICFDIGTNNRKQKSIASSLPIFENLEIIVIDPTDPTIEEVSFSTGNYTGHTRNHLLFGQGAMNFNNGDAYFGEWQNNLRHGTGFRVYSKSDPYNRKHFIGTWKNGKRSGFGILTWKDGDIFIGNYENDSWNGLGKHFFPDSSSALYYEGNFKNGEFNGRGVHVQKDGDRYEGEHKNGLRHGQGTYKYKSGSVYKGEWVDGDKHGFGTYTYEKSSIYDRYEGNYVNDESMGHGTFLWKNGDKYIGEFKSDYIFDGFGTKYSASGQILKQGQWKDDEFVG